MDVRRWVKVALCVTMGMAMVPMSNAQEMGGTTSVSANAGGNWPPPPNPPTCPEEFLGELNGIYYYITSNCVDASGYGSSTEYIQTPQCQGGVCGQPIATMDIGAGRYLIASFQPPGATPAEIAKWVTELQARKTLVEKGVNGRSNGDTRRTYLAGQLADINQTLQTLNSATASPVTKRAAYDKHTATMDTYTKSFRFVGLAGRNEANFAIRDVKSKQPLKTAAETSFSTANVNAGRVRVTATKAEVLKVQVSARQTVYFQCFDLLIEKQGDPQLKTWHVGIQVKPDGVTNPVNSSFSERGNFAHRLRDASDTPYLVNSIDSLEPQ
jgi:hypothetical protein